MTDFLMVTAIVAFFAAAALLVRALDRVVAGTAAAGEDDFEPAAAREARPPAPRTDQLL
jgi:hypothetical protein